MGGPILKGENLKKILNLPDYKVQIGDAKFSAEKLDNLLWSRGAHTLLNSEDISFPMRPVKGISLIFKTEKIMFTCQLMVQKHIYST